MKTILFYTAIMLICFLTFSPRQKMNPSEVETIKVNKSYLKGREQKAVNEYGYFVFEQADNDLRFASLALAVIKTESNFESGARSYKGAIGMMQLMPETAMDVGRELGIEVNEESLEDPRTNIKIGINYIKYLRSRLGEIENSDRKLILILASYNSGLHRVKRAFKCRGFECYIKRANLCNYEQFNANLKELPEETRLYLESVKKHYDKYKRFFNVT